MGHSIPGLRRSYAAYALILMTLLSSYSASAAEDSRLPAQRLTPEHLQELLTARKSSWRAGRTAVSDLDDSERRLLLGVPLSEIRTDAPYGRTVKTWEDALPEKFDWRNYNGIDYVSPVKNQGRCGSCVAFAAGSTLETQMNILTQSQLHGWNFSTQHLFSCGGGSCSSGWFPSSAVNFLADDGMPEEACFPYVSGALGQNASCRKSCADSKTRSLRATVRVRSKPIRGASVDEVKQALINGPLMTTMKVFSDFYLYTGGVYRHQTGGLLGGHAVMIIGWSNEDRAWIARNSWGTDWGEQGDFRIAWDDPSGVGGLFYGIQPAQSFSGLILEGLTDHRSVRVPTDVVLRAHETAFVSAELEIRGGAAAPLVSRRFGSDGRLVLNPHEFTDGIYTVQARARLADGSQRISQARLIYIRTGKQTASIKIGRMTPNMNVWDKIVPEFSVSSQPVPLAKIRYKIENEKGVIVRVRQTEHTADRVAISLNPDGLPKGRYTLRAEAVTDEDEVVSSDSLEFNITAR